MSLIYTCDVCGMKTTDLGAALEHEKHCFARSVKGIDLSWDYSKNDFVFSVNFLSFSPETPTRREHIFDSGLSVDIYTEDMSEEHEKKLKNELLQAAIDYRAARIKGLEREIGELKSRMHHEDLS